MATNIPPHNVAEICDALSHLLKFPNARVDKLVDFIKGPDFPTGGTVVESRETIVEAYRTGRGSFRIRAKWEKEELKGGTYQVVVTEIPYQVAKSKLIERVPSSCRRRSSPSSRTSRTRAPPTSVSCSCRSRATSSPST